ncbi:MAG TPA: hypothetical protein VNS32_23840 [Flavisolibacter sp.]|nr:hypothetical protein [Flavisolibacter sp.]
MRKQEQLNNKERELIVSICNQSSEIKTAASLVAESRQIMENKKGNQLGRWMKKAIGSVNNP